MKREEILFLDQMIKSLEEAGKNLEKAYERRDYENFNKSKRIMLKVQNEISNMLK